MRRILIVEDAPASRHALERLLQQEGYETIVAANGAEALAKLKAKPPDLILLDHMMPEVDGLTFLSSIRRFPKWKKLPVIMLTGVRDRASLSQAQALGVKEYLMKSEVQGDELVRQVNRHMGGDVEPTLNSL
jgi:CheY-like chemotaxis protein